MIQLHRMVSRCQCHQGGPADVLHSLADPGRLPGSSRPCLQLHWLCRNGTVVQLQGKCIVTEC